MMALLYVIDTSLSLILRWLEVPEWDLLTYLLLIVVTWGVYTPRNRVNDMLSNR